MSQLWYSLLAIFAHPGDEAYHPGGVLTLLARQGVRVEVLTAASGEAGSCGDPPLCTAEELSTIREHELRCACAALGIQPPRLLDSQGQVVWKQDVGLSDEAPLDLA